MVAVLEVDSAVENRLDYQAAHDQPLGYSEAWPSRQWKGARGHLAVILDQEANILGIGRAKGGRRITTRDRIVTTSNIHSFDAPIEAESFTTHLPKRHAGALTLRGILPPRAAEAVVHVLKGLHPELHDLIDYLGRRDEPRLPTGEAGQIINLERDAVGLALQLSGFPRTALRAWTPDGEDSFLSGMPRDVRLEDSLLDFDSQRFMDWTRLADVSVEWRIFARDERRLFVMNANRTAVERTLGVDLIYFNQHSASFVLVQYKRLSRDGKKNGELSYRPDRNLAGELERMARVDAVCQGSDGEFRLLATPCWLKLTDPTARVTDAAELLKGMYFAREHFEALLKSCHGPRGGVRIGYHNVDRHVTNTLFTQLVQDAWIGSRGVATTEIKRLIRESLDTGHAVVVGVFA